VEKKKAKRMPTMKRKLLSQKLTRKASSKERIVQKIRKAKARRKRLAHATTAE
jgi:hypothetical protein